MPRRFACVITLFSLLISLAATAAPKPIPRPPDTGARAFVIEDFNSGRILAEQASTGGGLVIDAEQAAEIFRECAGILEHQAANPFRVPRGGGSAGRALSAARKSRFS